MKNVVLWGFAHGDVRNILGKMHSDGIICIKRWIVEEGDMSQIFFKNFYIENASGWSLNDFFCEGKYPNKHVTDYIIDNIEIILQNFARDNIAYRLPRYEYINIIMMTVNHYYNILKDNDVEAVVFTEIPHCGTCVAMYYTAKAMGITTLIMSPVYDECHFMYSYSIEDWGIFKDIPEYYNDVCEVKIEKKYEKYIPYMNPDIIKKELSKGSHDLSYYLQPFIKPNSFWKKKKELIREQKKRYHDLDDFLERKLIGTIGRYFQNKRYNNTQKNSIKNIDFTRKYVYFPLHLQPEMTTDTLGMQYSDQLLAIEKLRAILPDDWYIYVKENPKQLSYMRGKYFFERLKLISNTVYVDRSVDTYKLIRNSQFVSTITGTVAWEAITGGKNALIFGKVWFDHCPGIFRYNDGITFQEIISYKVNHVELEQKVNQLRKKMVKGIFRVYNDDWDEKFDRKENYVELCRFFNYVFSK